MRFTVLMVLFVLVVNISFHRPILESLMFALALAVGNDKLKWSNEQPPRKRDLTVLRHTYIAWRLIHGASAWEVANNCRTSVKMIDITTATRMPI